MTATYAQTLDPNAELPVLIVDLDDAEAGAVLATLDPLAAMADADSKALALLAKEIDNLPADLAKMINFNEVESGGKAPTVLTDMTTDTSTQSRATQLTKLAMILHRCGCAAVVPKIPLRNTP